MSDKNAFVQQSYVVDQLISPTERFPNNEKLPLLIYKKALLLHPDDMEEKVIGLLKENGYENSWVGDVYDHDHFHTNTHEILVIFSGNAEIVFGGDAAKCQEVNRGDVIIIPAGVAHKKQKSSDNFLCIGAYPAGKDFDMNTHRERNDETRVTDLPVPSKDPVYGLDDGHLHKYWN